MNVSGLPKNLSKNLKNLVLTIGFFIFIACILLHPQSALALAYNGLILWFEKMVPTLLPFMIISSALILLDLDAVIVSVFSFLLSPIFRLSKTCIYAIMIGFFCGFPLGAKTAADLLKSGKISRHEASLIISFCNNLGPIYFNGFILHSLKINNKLPYIIGMYGIPLIYGLILRYTYYRGKIPVNPVFFEKQVKKKLSFPAILDNAISNSLISISKLAGYMVIFNVFNLLPTLLFQNNEKLLTVFALFFEISSGASKMISNVNLFTDNTGYLILFTALSFAGCSCLAQTGSVINGSGLRLKKYFVHRLMITLLSFLYYYFAI